MISPEPVITRDVIRARRSIRRYSEQPVTRDVIEQIMAAAVWAPSAHNRQPWRFCVVTDSAIKERLAAAMGDQLRRDLRADGMAEALSEADTARSYARIVGAPCAILLCLSMSDMDVYPDERRAHKELWMAGQSAAMAGQNILLTAHALGLGACWMCAPLFCPDIVRDALNLPDDWQPQALITLGYPAETKVKTRKPLEESIVWR